jgi:cytoskeletal protein CcmA (bactofilin family)
MFNRIKNKTQEPQEISAEVQVAINQDRVAHGAPKPGFAKPSILGESCAIEGKINSNGELHIEGKFKGEISVDKLTVSRTGFVSGQIKCRLLSVFGEVNGDIDCKELVLNPGANVTGKIVYGSIKVLPGTSIVGDLFFNK